MSMKNYVAMRDSPVKKNISKTNALCAIVQSIIITGHSFKKWLDIN